MIPEVEAAMGEAVADINAKEPVPTKLGDLEFVELAAKCAEATVQAWQLIVNEAQAGLERARLEMEALQAKVKVQGEAVKDIRKRTEAFSATLLRAHQTFHNGDKQ